MEYQGLKRQFDKLQGENTRMKVMIRQLRTENKHLQTRSRKNTTSRLGCNVQKPQQGEPGPGTLQQMPDAFRIQLVEKERKMAAVRMPLRPTGRNLAPLLGPRKTRAAMNWAHPLEAIVVKKLHRSVGGEAKEACQQQQQHNRQHHHRLLPSSQPTANPESGRRGDGARANEDAAWSMDSFGDNMRNFCKDLLLKAKARVAREKRSAELSETAHYEGPGRFDERSGSRDALRNPGCPTFTNWTRPLPACRPPPSSHRNSRLPRLRRIQALGGSGSAPQLCHLGNLPPSGEHRNERSAARRNRTRSISTTQNSSIPEIPPAAEPRTVLPLVRTCIPWSQSSDKLSQGPHRQNNRDQEQQRPLAQPQLGLDQSFQLLSSDNWEKKIEGLTLFRRLAQWHSDVLMTRLHDVCMATIQEVHNLRSLVSRVAVATLGDLYRHLQRAMDTELDWTATALIHKAGEPATFIRQEVDDALGSMLRGCTHARILRVLINRGCVRHHNVAVRECTSRHLVALVGSMGAARLLRCKKNVRDKFLRVVSRMPQDASQEVRRCGLQIMGVLGAHQEFQSFVP
ncbi:hypothetical protein AAFF_G00075080 [Aldrovandia affinis]|uniref:CLASP N-terminal domain-containing protein n=1 Tax=Aldrovandia affinis TaxID=143900 RepID=A0AAD7WD58_9TELE|nr:hypothetical protein AAFF_G00075080 [Aldrovandia affinis]